LLAYAGRLTDLSQALDFLILRIGRLWPLHATVAIFFLALMLVKSGIVRLGVSSANPASVTPDLLAQVGRDLIFLNAFVNPSWLTMNFPAWSINSEFWGHMLCSAFSALLLFLFAQQGRSR